MQVETQISETQTQTYDRLSSSTQKKMGTTRRTAKEAKRASLCETRGCHAKIGDFFA